MSVPLGRLLRTVRHLRPAQALAQLRHALSPGTRIRQLDVAPELALERAPVSFLAPGRHAACRHTDAAITIALLNRAVVFAGAVDWDHEGEGPLWSYHLHQFDWARERDVPPELRTALIRDWIDRHPAGSGWDPHPTSHRILSWGKLLLEPGAIDLSAAGEGEALRRSLASQLETLSRNVEVRLQANHLFTNLVGLVFGGLLFAGREADRWLGFAEALRAELRDQVYPDGAHEERSPMYHSLLLEQVLDLLNLAGGSQRAPTALVEDLRDTASRMCGALEILTQPDGEIALFSDAAFGVAAPPPALADYATALGVPVLAPEQPDRLPYAGFARLADEHLHLIASLAGPGPDHQPGHAHCDGLAFELSLDGERIVTDTGVFAYLHGADREAARATRSHATIEVDGRDQAECWSSHRIGGRPRVEVVEYTPGVACEATCAGWATPDTVHRRRFELVPGGLDVHDRLEGARRPVRLTLPLAPGLAPRLVGDAEAPSALHVSSRAGRELEIGLPGGDAIRWHLETADFFPEFGLRQQRYRLVGESARFDDGVWRFRVR